MRARTSPEYSAIARVAPALTVNTLTARTGASGGAAGVQADNSSNSHRPAATGRKTGFVMMEKIRRGQLVAVFLECRRRSLMTNWLVIYEKAFRVSSDNRWHAS